MNVLSLFDGCGMGYQALKNLGIKVDKYYASEIDKYAMEICKKNHPDVIQIGDINKIKGKELGDIDLIIGGFPCFAAGTKIITSHGYKNIEDIDIGDKVYTHNRRYKDVTYLFKKENNIWNLKIQGCINTETTSEHPYYVREMKKKWNNNLKKYERIFSEPKWKKVKDLKVKNDFVAIPIINIEENTVFEYAFCSEKLIELMKDIEFKKEIQKQSKAKFLDDGFIWLPVKKIEETKEKKTVYNFEVEDDNSYTANNIVVHNCQSFSVAGKKLDFDDDRGQLFFKAKKLIDIIKPKYFILENVGSMKNIIKDLISEQLEVPFIPINSNLVSAQQRNRLYWTNIKNITQPYDQKKYFKSILLPLEMVDEKYFLSEKVLSRIDIGDLVHCGVTGYKITGKERNKATALLARDYKGMQSRDFNVIKVIDKRTSRGYSLRKLTPIECERLQTLEDNYTQGVSDSQRYKMIGNGFTVKVIEHILKGIL